MTTVLESILAEAAAKVRQQNEQTGADIRGLFALVADAVEDLKKAHLTYSNAIAKFGDAITKAYEGGEQLASELEAGEIARVSEEVANG